MLKLIVCEFRKLKRKKLFRLAFATSFLMPLLYSILLRDSNLDDLMTVVREENGFLLLIPLTVVLAANLFFQEHDYDSLKNLACVPVPLGRLALAKLGVLLLFDVAYQMVGAAVAVLMALRGGIPLDGLGLQLALTLATGVLVWAVAMPCILLVVWCNKSYIISVLMAFAYTTLCFLLRITDHFMMVPLGLNAASLLPTPMVFRWLYQFHSTEAVGEATLAFYTRLSPYFVSTPVVFAVLLGEALVCVLLMMKLYRRQER